ncbi:cyclic peptide export ABC transporter [Methylorubrum thiocyanatum]|uniref:ATP-binding cassette transporter n=1 Tax=Methylorubrum thiocyanatum TaxID=47958 RepID=A0AA40S207_9HYPH|nr:cyclic peptide export ABC transporter [Methylorubrum thiocyanatum]MBA8912943.1 putative ATP-binding cassette transporter [Methylorubrum thiocyanatum]GJE83573.1 ABC transporter ATP-binding/permease protein YojI [Methylorubrum thiocyanatum]
MGQDKAVLRHFVQDAIRLLRPVWPLVAVATALGSVGGLATAAALAKINEAFYGEGGLADGVLLVFAGFAALSVIGTFAASLGNAYAGGRIQAALSCDLTDKILTAPIERLERLGKHKLLASLQGDVSTIFTAIAFLSPIVVAGGTLIGCGTYMLILSPALSAVTATVLILESLGANILRRNMLRYFEDVRKNREATQKHYLTLTEAAKELRIGRERRLHLRNVALRDCIEQGRRLTTRIAVIQQSLSMLSQSTNFLLFAGLIAYKILAGISGAELSGFVLVLLYIQTPIAQLIHFVPLIGQAQVAYRRIAEFAEEGAEAEAGLLSARPPEPPRRIRAITLRGVSHGFPAADDRAPFTLGPIDLTIRAGEILFIVGENGSGKTTLIKLLLGLYPPQTGEILLDGVAVTAQTRDTYRQHFSAIFFDYHLFDELIPADGAGPESARPLLERLDLAGKVGIAEGRFSTTDLSTGQRKRLALVQAALEGRPVLVLDEWAAEQDPTFRRRFYEELLPDLRRSGRTLVVISHDDRYFDAADRVLHLAEGRVVRLTERASATAEPV